MHHHLRMFATALLTMGLAGGVSSLCAAEAPAKPRVEVVFVLDSTSSMSGLIEGAKQKIWAIANTVVSQKPAPDVHFGLLTYRDRGDAYITKRFDLTDDLDAIYKDLTGIAAEGGGDEPESVNQALDEAVNKMAWSADPQVSKIIFLVGDSPPHMDYQDDVKYPATCQVAAKRGIIINTVQCGLTASTTPIWQEIARLAEGTYVAVAQGGGMVATSTPFDKDMAKLSASIGATTVPYGSREAQTEAMRKGSFAMAAPTPSLAADRAEFNAKSGGKSIQGRGDLVQDLAEGQVKLEAIKDADLPEPMQKLTPAERTVYLKKQQETRTALNEQLKVLADKRSAYLADEQKKLADAGKGDAFDVKVQATITEQMQRKK